MTDRTHTEATFHRADDGENRGDTIRINDADPNSTAPCTEIELHKPAIWSIWDHTAGDNLLQLYGYTADPNTPWHTDTGPDPQPPTRTVTPPNLAAGITAARTAMLAAYASGRDIGDWLSQIVTEAATVTITDPNEGSQITANRPGSWEADLVAGLDLSGYRTGHPATATPEGHTP